MAVPPVVVPITTVLFRLRAFFGRFLEFWPVAVVMSCDWLLVLLVLIIYRLSPRKTISG